jgi:hypothetical protein
LNAATRKRAGYVTIGIDNHGRCKGQRDAAVRFAAASTSIQGFSVQAVFPNKAHNSPTAPSTSLMSTRRSRFFMFVHLWDPHTPYSPREPYDTLHYEKNPDSPDLNDVIALAPEYYNAFLGDMKLKCEGDYDYVVSQYDGEISYVDHKRTHHCTPERARPVGQQHRVVMSDHGECFGEGNVYFRSSRLYDAVTRVALLWHGPESPPDAAMH